MTAGVIASSRARVDPGVLDPILDDFDRADSATLGFSAQGWEWDHNAEIEIVDGRAQNTSSDQPNAAPDIDLVSADHYLEVDFVQLNVVGTNEFRASVRGEFNAEGATINGYEVRYRNSGTRLRLERYAAGASTRLVDTSAGPGLPSSVHTLRIEVDGDHIRFFVDGSDDLLDYHDSTYTSQVRVGLGGAAQGSDRIAYDNFKAGAL